MAVVSFSPVFVVIWNTDCTQPLPYVLTPNSLPALVSCTAADTISEALALPWSIRTARGYFTFSSLDSYTLVLPFLSVMETTGPLGTI